MYSHESTEELPHYTREIQHAIMFRVSYPSIPKTIYLRDLNEEVSLSLGIMIHDAQIQMLISAILLCILYMGCIKNKYSSNIINVRKKEKLHALLFITKI